jgi:hypothetical protein
MFSTGERKIASTRAAEPPRTTVMGWSRSVRGTLACAAAPPFMLWMPRANAEMMVGMERPSEMKPPAATAPAPGTDEDFYPPDHHMHPANRAREPDPRVGDLPPPVENGGQAELDLTSPPGANRP